MPPPKTKEADLEEIKNLRKFLSKIHLFPSFLEKEKRNIREAPQRHY